MGGIRKGAKAHAKAAEDGTDGIGTEVCAKAAEDGIDKQRCDVKWQTAAQCEMAV